MNVDEFIAEVERDCVSGEWHKYPFEETNTTSVKMKKEEFLTKFFSLLKEKGLI